MSVIEQKVSVKEEVEIIIRDKDGKERIISYKPEKSSFFSKIKEYLGIKEHSSITSYGFEQMAKLLGNYTTDGPYYIDQLGSSISASTWQWKSLSGIVIYEGGAGSTLSINNSLDPWTSTGVDYIKIATRRSTNTAEYHNTIGIQVKIGTGGQWWAEMRFIFSQS